MKTYAMMVLGCKVNDYEAAYLKEQMDQDYEEVNFKDKADIYIIFTCCVTNIAESKTRKFIRQARRHNPAAYVVAVGCLSQARNDDPVFDEANLIIGSRHKDKIKEYIIRTLEHSVTIFDVKSGLLSKKINVILTVCTVIIKITIFYEKGK